MLLPPRPRIRHQGKGVKEAGDPHAEIEGVTMSRPEDKTTEAEPDSAQDADEEVERAEPGTPPIDEDVAGSVNAALPDLDEQGDAPYSGS
jgi:hypothetical protein